MIQIFRKWHYGQLAKSDARTSHPLKYRKKLVTSVIKISCLQVFCRLDTLKIFYPFPGKCSCHTTFSQLNCRRSLFSNKMTFQTAHLLRKVHCHIYFLEFFEFFEKKYFLDVSPIALIMVSLNDLVSY